MIEVNRALYMNESTGGKSSRFDERRSVVADVLMRTAQRFRLFKAYEETDFIIDAPGKQIHLRIGQRSPEADALLRNSGATHAAFVTAWNPGSIRLSPEENKKRQRSMEEQIQTAGFPYHLGRGEGLDPSWKPEESAFIIGIPRGCAVAFSAQFGQNAIVWHEIGERSILLPISSSGSGHDG